MQFEKYWGCDAYLNLLHHQQTPDRLQVFLSELGDIIQQNDNPRNGHASVMIFGVVLHRYSYAKLASRELGFPKLSVRT